MEEDDSEFIIDTQNIYYQIKNKRDDFSSVQLKDFKERLQRTLIVHSKVNVVFDPTRWRYHRRKFLEQQEREQNDIFALNFFTFDTKGIKRRKLNDLSDDEKIQIIAPKREDTFIEEQRASINITKSSKLDILKHLSPLQSIHSVTAKRNHTFSLMQELKNHEILIFENLNEEKRKEILNILSPISNPIEKGKVKSGLRAFFEGNKKRTNSLNNNDPYNWYSWGYDIYSYDISCELDFTKDRLDFEYFFAWQLSLITFFEVDPFLQWHLVNTFQNDKNELKKFVEILYLQYDEILTNKKTEQVVFKNLHISMEEQILTPKVENENDKVIKKLGRKLKEKIEIPIPPARGKEKWTIFTKDETIELFDYLITLGCFINDTKKVSKNSLAKIIYALTGYSDNNTAELFLFEKNIDITLKKKKEYVEKVKELIISKLK